VTPFPHTAVLVDFGGTLDGDGIHWSHRFDRVFRGAGLEYTDEALQRAFRASEDVLNSDLGFPDLSLAIDLAEELTGETRGYLARNSTLLRSLKGRVPVGVLSNFTGNLEIILREEGLLEWVDAVFDSAVVGLRKPDPEFFRHALKTLGAGPEGAVMVGDSVDMDLRPAAALGLATVWVEGERARSTDFVPGLRVRSVTELPALWVLPS
jgi:HAD superfamily hydrolase (TIGR01549 family)